MSQINVRNATALDVPLIYELILELAMFERGLSEVTMTKDELLRDGFGKDPLYKAIVAEVDGEVVGTAIYFYSYSTWNGKCLYLEDLIVKRECRTGGIGTALMKELIKTAKKEDAKRMSWQVLNWNVDAQDFYRKFGAELDENWLNGRLNEEQISKYSA